MTSTRRQRMNLVRGPAWQAWLRQHQLWLLGGVPITMAMFSVMSATHYDHGTAMAVLRHAGTLQVLASTLYAAVPMLLLVTGLTLWLAQPNPFGLSHWGHVVINFAAGLALLSVLPYRFVFGVTSLMLLIFIAIPSDDVVREVISRFRLVWLKVFVSTGVLMLILRLTVFDFMWLPPEIVMHGGREQRVGYVLDDDGRWLTLLRERDRRIQVLPSDTVVGRVPCTLPATGHPFDYMFETPSLVAIATGRPASTAPTCGE